jgi:carboxyl-terminal processing protease
VQTLVPLNRGQLKITAAKFYRVSGQSTQHQGILPDIAFPEVYDSERVGESSLDDAMPWDMIQPAVYPRSEQISPLLGELQVRHEERVADNPDFLYLNKLSERSRENTRKTHLSLNEQVRNQEKADDDAWRLRVENELRVAKGEEPVESLDALEEIQEALAESEEEPEDAMLIESGNVLLDYLGLLRQVALAESTSGADQTAVQ